MSCFQCKVCGSEPGPEGRKWLMLNRYAIGTGTSRRMAEALDEDGDYGWHSDPEGPAQDDFATGVLLCWPECAYTYVEAEMIETDFQVEKQGR